MAMKILGPSTVAQAAVPDILTKVPDSFHERNIHVFEVMLQHAHGLVKIY